MKRAMTSEGKVKVQKDGQVPDVALAVAQTNAPRLPGPGNFEIELVVQMITFQIMECYLDDLRRTCTDSSSRCFMLTGVT